MVRPESLSQYLLDEYQCYGVSMESKITNFFGILILVTKEDLSPSLKN
jgi:hypothetical protein